MEWHQKPLETSIKSTIIGGEGGLSPLSQKLSKIKQFQAAYLCRVYHRYVPISMVHLE
jgi:hypothetical protein